MAKYKFRLFLILIIAVSLITAGAQDEISPSEVIPSGELDSSDIGIKKVDLFEIVQPVNLSQLNSKCADFAPYIMASGNLMFFSTSRTGGKGGEDIWFARSSERGWTDPQNLGVPINTGANEGSLTITPDGNEMYFTVCGRDDSYGGCDLYYSRRERGGWTEPVNLGMTINSSSWEAHPSISPDGKTLYFASRQFDGYGGIDIYYSVKTGDDWAPAKMLEYPINNARDQTCPFIHSDGKTMYFSSSGHGGLGGLDVFKTTLEENGKWSLPVNLGSPLNTAQNDYFLSIPASGEFVYFASDRKGGFGNSDIYRVGLEEALQPKIVATVVGKVIDKNSSEPLDAEVLVERLSTGEELAHLSTNPETGEYLVVLPAGEQYSVSVSAEGYVFSTNTFEIQPAEGYKELHWQFELQPVEVGEKIVINNIFFDFDKSEIKPESESELNRVIQLFNKYPNLKIEIQGYADSVGHEAYNLWLSQTRAEAVMNYLLDKGVSQDRLSAQGFGIANPVAPNLTAEGRRLNRRTEFHIISK
ncbi:PD40 domain-containing protein [bacterium]|nr:PD40 domain-containing protein [bacterium]